VTEGEQSADDGALAQLGIGVPSASDLSLIVLQRLGVPTSAVRLLPERPTDTKAEVDGIARTAAGQGRCVILVTSKYHTRRARLLARRAFARQRVDSNSDAIGCPSNVIVRYPSTDPFSPVRWWRSSADAGHVIREWLGLADALVGFPGK
jgi:uncharacterized SAM-binding protein YcdF (DUF218 family)